MTWNHESELNFLEAYQKEAILWDPTHSFHNDNKHLHDAWVRIGNKIGFPIADLKKKRDSLMATYLGHLHKIKNSQHTGAGLQEIYKPVWFAFDLMDSFLSRLNECKESRDTDNKVFLPQPHESEKSDSKGFNESPSHDDESTIQNKTTESNINLRLAPRSIHRRRKYSPELQETENDMKEAIATLNRVLNSKMATAEEDDCDMYGKILSNKLRRLPEMDKLQLMHDIDGLFIKKLQQLQQNERDHFLPYAKTPSSSYSESVMTDILPRRPPSSYTLNPVRYSQPPLSPILLQPQQSNDIRFLPEPASNDINSYLAMSFNEY